MTERAWYVDSSVLLRALREQSPAARTWFEERVAAGDRFVASRLVEVEVRRVTKSAGVDQDVVTEYLDELMLAAVDNALMDEAIAIDEPLGGADAIHVATALRVGPAVLTVVTHDRQMEAAARALGFATHDPVTDDPGRAAVTERTH